MSTIAYQGEPGAYGEQAAFDFFGASSSPMGVPTFDRVFECVVSAEADFGIVPIENSLAGSIHRNYDLLMRHDLRIVGETVVRVSHQLLALPGVKLEDIERIYSHWQPLGQCERSLASLLPNAERIEVYDTAGSAKMVKEENRRDTAAIASQRAGKLYGLAALREAIEDDPTNYTRFVVLARTTTADGRRQTDVNRHSPIVNSKTSIVFATRNEPGSLFHALAVFALRKIDLSKIESRPLQGSPWEYLFYLDFAGDADEPNCKRALDHLREFATILRVLGSYPRAEMP
jgi:prephenate dehydratase